MRVASKLGQEKVASKLGIEKVGKKIGKERVRGSWGTGSVVTHITKSSL